VLIYNLPICAALILEGALIDVSAEDGVLGQSIANVSEGIRPVSGERSPLLAGRDNRAAVARQGRITLAALYAIQVFYSFFIM
jgi:copper transporter 1